MTNRDSTWAEWFKELEHSAKRIGHDDEYIHALRTYSWRNYYDTGFSPQEAIFDDLQEQLYVPGHGMSPYE